MQVMCFKYMISYVAHVQELGVVASTGLGQAFVNSCGMPTGIQITQVVALRPKTLVKQIADLCMSCVYVVRFLGLLHVSLLCGSWQ